MIAWQDLVNGLYECSGAPFILLSILKLHRDKKVRGVHWIYVLFFASWGYWNLYYYPHLGQWCSFFGGLMLVLTNTFWLFQMIYYLKKEEKK